MDKTPIITVILIILAGFLFWGFQSGFFIKNPGQTAQLPSGIVLFFGEECPHCKNVDDFISQNKIEDKVKFTRLEVPFAQKTSPQLVANAKLAIQLAQSCKLDASNGVGIPFLYDPPIGEAGGSGKCVIGDVDTINFFKNAADIK
ncbi:MAG: hypothetical protein A2358_01640 [Candidatus Staskawiczbacteria bacterium RIFOXYB1_FULL_37_44]|uniref:Thioredoxin domain-containing protein n=1 Tax=Candidatus Staskawiczbacteria bacterium RIFOXYB1_FULL_37_44 TaxID=1802223 RepID=A0A1G2IZX8_9BACT|nr:MAG: hypothetical protein A2358_01640 [Candidatus Staskawiczbacteria bacterium RIFOXYB1_FULL_37_44]OGZ83408.1 MAG: hypothetical protein A2416_02375 [Candidatus Staskawiczbacteria bacterium RIFOXYC1_FULL_37_52]OGZ88237.1 MAG: hypothetical protein A2444_00425 [Candidatus Staskawiczbacteria bacterium RIFOXYC2_FULL_37_19]OGZ88811.1 MAG: hypothetical protein A2581_03315 [Candidatus Staskawiczbacteria bacterium RIFOXYD1_FULL_37_110]